MLKSIRRRLRKAVFFTSLTRYSSTLEVPLPTHIQVEPTTRCNALCGSCSRSSLANNQLKNDLQLETIERILETFPDLKSIRLLGLGEPFLHPEFEKILKRLRERDIKIWLISNGSLLANDHIRRLLHTYIDDVGFSIDSADPDEFRALRPMGRIGLPEEQMVDISLSHESETRDPVRPLVVWSARCFEFLARIDRNPNPNSEVLGESRYVYSYPI